MRILTNDEQVQEVIRKLRVYQIVPNELEIKYNCTKRTLLFLNQGVGELIQDEVFYEALEENLYYIMKFIVDRLMSLLQCDFTLRIKVDADGSIDTKNIGLESSIYIIDDIIDKQRYVYERLKLVLPLYSFITKVSFRRHQHEIRNINLFLSIDSTKFNNCLKNIPNLSILSQWVSTYMQVKTHFTNTEYNYAYELNVTNGRMHFASRNDALAVRFCVRGGE